MTNKILIVDPVATNRIVLRARLAVAHFDVVVTSSYRHAMRLTASNHFEVIIIGCDIAKNTAADADLQSLALLSKCASKPVDRAVLITMRDADAGPSAEIWEDRCRAYGADECLSRPIPFELMLARIRNLMRDRVRLADLPLPIQVMSGKVLQVQPKPAVAILAVGGHDGAFAPSPLTTALLGELHPRSRVFDGDLTRLTRTRHDSVPPGVVILDAAPKNADQSIALLPQIRSSVNLRDTRVMLRVVDAPAEKVAMAYDLGVHDVVCADLPVSRLAKRVDHQLHLHTQETLQKNRVKDQLQLAIRDPLTGLHNRRYAMEHLNQLLTETLDHAEVNFALLALDIDHFKSTNDRFGHAAGDQVLQAVARSLQANVRGGDLVARTGGEEFLIALSNSDHDGALRTAERIRREIAKLAIPVESQSKPIGVTMSIGLVTPSGERRLDHLLASADKALYSAKSGGRNTVSLFSQAA